MTPCAGYDYYRYFGAFRNEAQYAKVGEMLNPVNRQKTRQAQQTSTEQPHRQYYKPSSRPTLAMMDMDYNAACNTSPLEEPELRNVASDHAVKGSTSNMTPSSSPPPPPVTVIAIRPKSLSRKSLYLNDVLVWKRPSLSGSSFMSSLTLTDYEDSFFDDYAGSRRSLSGWDEDIDEDNEDEGGRNLSNSEVPTDRLIPSCPSCSCPTLGDDKPTRPVRRDSVASSRAPTTRCCNSNHEPLRLRGTHQGLLRTGEREHPTKMNDNRDQDHHPIKPGRKGSIAGSATKEKPVGVSFYQR